MRFVWREIVLVVFYLSIFCALFAVHGRLPCPLALCQVDRLEDENCTLKTKLLWLENQLVVQLKQTQEPNDLRKAGDANAIAMGMADEECRTRRRSPCFASPSQSMISLPKSFVPQAEISISASGSPLHALPTNKDEQSFRSKLSPEPCSSGKIDFEICEARNNVTSNAQKPPFSFFFREELPAAPVAIQADNSDNQMEEVKTSRSVISKACVLI